MFVKESPLKGLFILNPSVFKDERGYFFESFNSKLFAEKTGLLITFVQDNESKSQKNVLRGLHFQNPPFAQGKLVRVIKGSVLDVAVDIRRESNSYGRHIKQVLSEQNKTMMYIPEGFAHGFVTLENDTIFSYKCTNYYNKESEKCLLWNDKTLNINWDVENPILSEKDKLGQNFSSLISKY
ncbi:MAG: dTDP-4-dehydrorhamnose 3,5-epimerase [Bacteroidota bacterium]|nr:dTDP-4-dehydrorhamnose 3,5-epimerase [Bacteroidota bacterium]